jgi:hypothetical protein
MKGVKQIGKKSGGKKLTSVKKPPEKNKNRIGAAKQSRSKSPIKESKGKSQY